MSIDLTFIGQIVIFLSLVYLMMKHLYGPLNDALEARSHKIAEGLAAADAGKDAAAKAELEAKKMIDEAKTRAHDIVSSAEKRAAAVAEGEKDKAHAEALLIVDAAREEAGSELERARLSLRKEVADLSLVAAEKILGAELDAKKHAKLIDSVIDAGVVSA
ncbi:MAG: F0F1 ATP synthase subunit B [Mariprofundaceae bacterium]